MIRNFKTLLLLLTLPLVFSFCKNDPDESEEDNTVENIREYFPDSYFDVSDIIFVSSFGDSIIFTKSFGAGTTEEFFLTLDGEDMGMISMDAYSVGENDYVDIDYSFPTSGSILLMEVKELGIRLNDFEALTPTTAIKSESVIINEKDFMDVISIYEFDSEANAVELHVGNGQGIVGFKHSNILWNAVE